MDKKIYRLEELSSAKLSSFEKDKTIFFLTVSPIENHGPHLPLGMDIIEGEAINKGVMAKFRKNYPDWHVILCPTVTMGYDMMPGTGSIVIRQSVIRDYLIDYFSSLARKGFKHIFVSGFHGGPRHLVAVDEAVHYVNKKYKAKIVAPFGHCITYIKANKMRMPTEALQALFDENREDVHGGLFETSFMMHVRPDLVDDCSGFEKVNILDKNLLRKKREWQKGLKLGYLGNPALAKLEIGEMLLKDATDIFYDMLEKSMQDDKHLYQVKSLMTRLPFMRTNFLKRFATGGARVALSGIAAYLLYKKGQQDTNGTLS